MQKHNVLWWFLIGFVIICAFAFGVKVGDVRRELRGQNMMQFNGYFRPAHF